MKQPILFIGHGSPMNAIENNVYTDSWKQIAKTLEKPRAILMFSAHWITEGETRISMSENPEMIYDMGGFPPELYQVRYDAPGSREIAKEIVSVIASAHFCHTDEGSIYSEEDNQNPADSSLHSEGQKPIEIVQDPTRGFDHGAWSTLVHLFPAADIPVITMSLDYRSSPRELFRLGESLAILRSKGVLIIGTGNIVHNLSKIDWSGEYTYSWAIEFDRRISDGIVAGKNTPEFETILDFQSWGDIARLAHPSYDHLLPLFPLMGASSTDDRVEFYTPDIAMGSLSMRSVVWR